MSYIRSEKTICRSILVLADNFSSIKRMYQNTFSQIIFLTSPENILVVNSCFAREFVIQIVCLFVWLPLMVYLITLCKQLVLSNL